MPVEHLVVDDHDVGEAVDGLAVAVDDGGRAVGGPEAGLAGPVHLHDVGDDGQQREGAGGLGGQQGLRGLAETRLVGEQEGAMPLGGGLDHLGLVRHQLELAGHVDVLRVGQRHRRGGPVADVLEGPEERAEQLPAGEPARLGLALVGGGEVGDEEGVGQLTREHRLRDDPAVGHARGVGVFLGLLLLGDLHAGAGQHLPTQRVGLVGDDGRLGQQGEQRRLAGGGLGQDRGDAVEPLELTVALALRQGGVGPDAGALLAGQQGDRLEARADGDGRTALYGGLDLAHGPREDRDQALVVELTTGPLVARRGTPT